MLDFTQGEASELHDTFRPDRIRFKLGRISWRRWHKSHLRDANWKRKEHSPVVDFWYERASTHKELVIAVMGPTGTGKSSFINLLCGSNFPVGDAMESCTTSVQATAPFDLDGYRVTVIDTPGFDDSTLKDIDVLTMIAAYLSFSYQHDQMLTGIVYMHRILDNRMGGISSRNFRMFRNLCGEKTLANVAIATSMWEEVDRQVGEAREEELASKENFFKPALDKGARMFRHSRNQESARRIIRSFFGREPKALLIQQELDANPEISQTSAGKELTRDFAAQVSQHRKEIQVLIEEMNEASRLRDEETRKELAEERAKLQEEVQRIQEDTKNLTAAYAEALAKLEQKVKDTESAVKGDATSECSSLRELQLRSEGGFKNLRTSAMNPDNAVLEAKLGGAFPIFGFWGKLAVMLSPFSLTWR